MLCRAGWGEFLQGGIRKYQGLYCTSAELLIPGDRAPLVRVCVGLESPGIEEFRLPP